MPSELDLQNEVKRKKIHYIGLSVPVLYYFTGKELMLVLIGLALISFIIIDYLRLYTKNKYMNYLFGKDGYRARIKIKSLDGKHDIDKSIAFPTLDPLLRSEEKRSWGSHTFYALGSFLCILFYTKNIAIAATAALLIGDSFAALVGKTIGRHRIYKKKTLEGSSACFLSCLVLYYFILPVPIAIIGAVATTLTELYSTRINDNLTIPLVSGGVMTLANYIF
ncbi:MAG: hypothetical protein JW825_05940 [Candidatus Methanofastidiosa archaeon]|nr:hypothetical protein [Candidatus Methanofastidiosa archaeon]